MRCAGTGAALPRLHAARAHAAHYGAVAARQPRTTKSAASATCVGRREGRQAQERAPPRAAAVRAGGGCRCGAPSAARLADGGMMHRANTPPCPSHAR